MGWENAPIVKSSWKDAPETKKEPEAKAQPGMLEDIERSLYGTVGTALKGFQSGGPLGAMASMTQRGVEKAGELVSETAYKAGGGVTDIAAKAGLPPEVAAAAGFGTNVGIQALPVAAGSIARQAAPVMEKAGKWFMTSAIKPGTTMRRSGEGAKAIETMLQKGISPTSSGLQAAKGAVDDLEVAIQTTLENSPGYVRKSVVGQNAIDKAFADVKHNLSRVQNEKDIDSALKDFLNHPEIKRYSDQFPVAVANRMKQAFTKELGERAYVPGAQPTAYDKGQKALATSLREEVSKAEPGVKANLSEQHEMMRVMSLLKERVGASQNQNMYGLGGAISPSVTRLLIFWADRYPWFKGWLARGLYTGASPVTAGVGVGAGVIAGEEIGEAIEKRNK
jgi:hypothetical protein